MNVNTLLADPAAIEIVKIVSESDSITIVVESIQKSAACPLCNQKSSSLKTRYLRRFADLPWHGVAVRVELHSRKFRCRNEFCTKKVFCERLPKVVEPYSRRTIRLKQVVELLAFSIGARAAGRAATELAFSVGKDACLRIMRRRAKNNTSKNVRILGIDDFAFRKGTTYGTILVDLEKRKPIDLLPDRDSETLTQWLKAHPEVEIISRDRSTSYADAGRSGAPQAEQVADRWHLLKNLSDLVERFFIQNNRLLTQTAAEIHSEQLAKESEIRLPSMREANQAAASGKPIPERRQQLFDAVKELQSKGVGIRAIARKLGAARNTVKKYLRCETPPRHARGAGKPSSVLPFAEYLEKRWREGAHNGFLLWQEIKTRGFRGEIDSVQRFIRPWRTTTVGKTFCPVSLRGLAPRKVAKLLLNPLSEMTKAEQNYLTKLLEIAPTAVKIKQLGIEFQEIVKERRADSFDDWLHKVRQSEVKELQNWANGLLSDESAVRTALSMTWSNGQTEGQVNRLKTIKRAMYGRAKFDLLRARVLYQN